MNSQNSCRAVWALVLGALPSWMILVLFQRPDIGERPLPNSIVYPARAFDPLVYRLTRL